MLFTIIGVILFIWGIFQLLAGDILWGIVLMVIGALLCGWGPFTGSRRW